MKIEKSQSKNKNYGKRLFLGSFNFKFIAVVFIFSFLFFNFDVADAATLRLSPQQGEFEVGETFDVDIILNTEGQTINTLQASLAFPADMMQVVAPSSGTSIVGVWTAGPRFDNSSGVAEFQGIIPGGINVSEGLVARITFRPTRPGNVFVRFLDDSAVLLHDGQGTHALRQTHNASYSFVLPPPAGPTVSSNTHPDQERWYDSSFVSLSWEQEEGVQGYSYVMDREPATTPDNIAQGTRTSTTYENLSDGTHYFHIKALGDDVWGGTTHYAINIDTTSPADFDINIAPGPRTANRQPVINFTTTDEQSGFDFYEIKIVPLQGQDLDEGFEEFFIETTSPYTPPALELGTYDVIVRAHDRAGNTREVTQRLEITTALFTSITRKGIELRGEIIISWFIIFFVLGVLLALLGIAAKYFYDRHKDAHRRLNESSASIDNHKREMERYRQTYNRQQETDSQPPAANNQQHVGNESGNPPQSPDGPVSPEDRRGGPGSTGGNFAVFLAITSLMLSFAFASPVSAEEHSPQEESERGTEEVSLSPPVISTVSENIFNNEIFYIGGYTDSPEVEVVLYVQNLDTGATTRRKIKTDEEGRWFYSHDSFLGPGEYLLWVQSSLGEAESPPSAQKEVTVRSAALSIGASRVSYEDIYFALALLMFVALAALSWFVIHHRKHAIAKQRLVLDSIHKTEKELRGGFATLRKDIQAELDIINKAKLNKGLSEEQEEREKQLLQDLEDIERRLEGDLWEIEHS